MCGGEGTRLDARVEKPLFEIADRPMIEHVATALLESRVDTIHPVVSPNAPETRRYVRDQCPSVIETPGEGYVHDLDLAIDVVDPPVLSVACDLPLIDAEVVDKVLNTHEQGSLTVCLPTALKEMLNVGTDLSYDRDGRELTPAGVNIVSDSGEESMHVSYDLRLAVNVNRRSDAGIAERLL